MMPMMQQPMMQQQAPVSAQVEKVEEVLEAKEETAELKDKEAVEELQPAQDEGDAWAQQFSQAENMLMQQQNPFMNMNFGQDNVNWQEALAKAQEAMKPKDPVYAFSDQKANPFNQDQSPYEKGIQLFNAGRVKEAIQAFEAAVTKDAEHADAWRYLGQANAENEQEDAAIAALLNAVKVDPYNLEALMMLGVSYTNDLEESRALKYLKTWLLNNPDYQTEALEMEGKAIADYEALYGNQEGFDNDLHAQVAKMFMNAVKTNPRDPDLHIVLGVLYHITSDWEKSIASFKNALKLKPDDARLWNKLGATQANSSQSYEAMYAYKRALQLRPTYVRALANLAIAFANQGLHEDAARTYLATLKQNPLANHIWSYLRISLSHLGNQELVALTRTRDVEAFRKHFDF